MWAASFVLMGDCFLDDDCLRLIRFSNVASVCPNALFVQAQGRDWYGKPKQFTQIEWQRLYIDFVSCTGEMVLHAERNPVLSSAEKQQIISWLNSKSVKAWKNRSSDIRRILG